MISNFIDTSESPFGQLVLRRMFEYADKDGNGTLDKEEVREALKDAVAAFGTGGVVELASPATMEAVYWAIEKVKNRHQVAAD